MRGVTRIAVPPLRRLVTRKPELKAWLSTAAQTVAKSDPSFAEFSSLLRQFPLLADEDTARSQIGRFYGEWIKRSDAMNPQAGHLPLPGFFGCLRLGEIPTRHPSEAGSAEVRHGSLQFMGNCL